MKNFFCLFSALLFLQLPGQEVEFRNHKINYKLSYETLKMQGEEDIGMAGIGADMFIFEKLPNLYLTLNSYSAITGERPGLISFGAGLGYVQPLFNSHFALDAGVFVGGGGGANAPDGGGLITREHLNLLYRFKGFSIFGGYSRLDFPTGSMGGNNLNFGVSVSSSFDTAHMTSANSADDTEMKNHKFRITMLGTRYLKFFEGPFPPSSPANSRENNSQLLGVEIDKFINNRFYAALKLNGAVTGGIDGYMSYLIGFGYEQPLWKNSLSLDAQALLGPSGGGGVDTGGGGIVQGTLGLRADFGEYGLKAGLGQSYAPEGNFNGTFFELGLTRNFNFISPQSQNNQPYRLKIGEKLHGFGLEFLNRTYFPPRRLDKNNKEYDKLFNLLGFQLSKDLNKNFSVLGSTYWAYQGSYGAYAEGWLGLQYAYPFAENWSVDARFLGGAAGGGGIDLGSGLAIQYGAGLAGNISDSWVISLNGGKMQGIKGNFNPYFLDLGIEYKFGQISKK